jgi:hypothetical protein
MRIKSQTPKAQRKSRLSYNPENPDSDKKNAVNIYCTEFKKSYST